MDHLSAHWLLDTVYVYSASDRERFFDPSWGHVVLETVGAGAAQLTRYHRHSRERTPSLVAPILADGYCANRLAPWTRRKPPVMELEHTSVNCL
jgi:hypothetical protein